MKQERAEFPGVYYAYTVNGKTYQQHESYDSSNNSWPDAGAAVTVWYDPIPPSLSSHDKPGPGLSPYGPYFLALPICVAILIKTPRNRPMDD